jgi:hypothetical protein
MRLWALVAVLVAACGSIGGDGPDAAPPPADARAVDGRADARPVPDAPDDIDAAPTADAPPPSTANQGWIGGACRDGTDCHFTDGMCLTDGFPNGMCTEECDMLCPDMTAPGDTTTFCVDGKAWGFDRGLCVSRCDTTQFPGTGCAGGYHCVPRNRFLDPSTVQSVCVPDPGPGACPGATDELVELDYPDKGMIWIPAEAHCGGAFPLVIMLHGINPSMNPTPSLGGGRHLEYEVRSLIDAKIITPVILAEPVQLDADSASSSTLYDSAHWDPVVYMDKIVAITGARHPSILFSSLSYTGHSGAGCDPQNGLYQVLDRVDDLVPAYAPAFKLWGAEDICYSGDYHWQEPVAALAGRNAVILNIFTVQGDPTEFEDGLIPDPMALTCNPSLLMNCIAHKTEHWCSYRTDNSIGITHDSNPYVFVREAFPQVFSTDPITEPCR